VRETESDAGSELLGRLDPNWSALVWFGMYSPKNGGKKGNSQRRNTSKNAGS
jgi:hypothetical protein